ncbi:MAG: N-acetylmuramoyl-L-alanine amidase [Clostridia bacterium]|nr:N-acetylmuramoyl-L-alanine amidase [Clostridia bacterium]
MIVQVIKDLVSESKYNLKCTYAMTPEFIVVHNTGNDASAKNEIAYMKKNDSSTSYHFAIDDVEVRQGVPLDRNAWHAGDGANGKGNRFGIGIEICYSKSGGAKFDEAEDNAAQFIAKLLKEYGWDISHVKKHQDFSGKYCPHRTLNMGWGRFLEKVKRCMNMDDENTNELTTVNDIVWELSHRGIITNKELWLKKLEEDENAYWLARKCVNYMKKI